MDSAGLLLNGFSLLNVHIRHYVLFCEVISQFLFWALASDLGLILCMLTVNWLCRDW